MRAAVLGAAGSAAAIGVVARPAMAHVEPAERIAIVDRDIAADPENAGLHARRALLHEEEADWGSALAGLDRAAWLDPSLEGALALPRARILLAAGDAAGAIALARHALAACGTSAEPEAHLVIARGLRAAGGVGCAVAVDDAFARAQRATAEPRPDAILERAAAAQEGLGPEPALAVLDEGVAQIGSIATIELAAIEIETGLGRTDAALARIERVVATAQRREPWDARAGAILEAAGRTAEARRAFEASRRAIEALPAPRRRAPATIALAERVTAALARLDGGEAPTIDLDRATEKPP